MDQKTPTARLATPAMIGRAANAGSAQLAPTTLLIFALACGFSVANVYMRSRCSKPWPRRSASALRRSGSSSP